MARIAGVELPKTKRMEVALTYIYGIGPSSAKKILLAAGVSPDIKAGQLADHDESKLRSVIEKNHTVEGELRAEVQRSIGRLVDIGCYRGVRHRKGLPVRGQRTHTNARTRKGKRRAAVGLKKKAAKK